MSRVFYFRPMNKKAIWQIVFEFLSIVFAVLLALGLNSYKQSRDLQAESEALKLQITQECESNLEKINWILERNGEFKSYLDSLRKEENVKGFSFNYSNEFLSSSIWNSSQGSSAFHTIDPDFLSGAAEIYELQDFYMSNTNDLLKTFGDILMQLDNDNTNKMIHVAHYYLTNILSTAAELQETYEEFLAQYGVEAAK